MIEYVGNENPWRFRRFLGFGEIKTPGLSVTLKTKVVKALLSYVLQKRIKIEMSERVLMLTAETGIRGCWNVA